LNDDDSSIASIFSEFVEELHGKGSVHHDTALLQEKEKTAQPAGADSGPQSAEQQAIQNSNQQAELSGRAADSAQNLQRSAAYSALTGDDPTSIAKRINSNSVYGDVDINFTAAAAAAVAAAAAAPAAAAATSSSAASSSAQTAGPSLANSDPGAALDASASVNGATPTKTYVVDSLFKDGWQDTLVPFQFQQAVAKWGEQKGQCSLQITHRNVTGYTAKPLNGKGDSYVTQSQATDRKVNVVEKRVQVQVPKIVEKRVPMYMNVTHDQMVYQTINHTVLRHVLVDQVQQRNITVQVPNLVDNIVNVTLPGRVKQVIKQVDKAVTVEVPRVSVDEVLVAMNINQEEVVYVNQTMRVQRLVTVPKVTKRQRQIEVVTVQEIEKNFSDAGIGSNPASSSGDSSAPLGVSPPQDQTTEVEVAKIIVQEVQVPVTIYQDKIVYKTIKQRVERRVEVPEVQIVQRIVDVPQFKEVIREVPVIEVRQRVVEVIKEEMEVTDVVQEIDLVEERLYTNETIITKQVNVLTETPEVNYQQVEVPEAKLKLVQDQANETINAVEWTNITQEVLEIQEQIEYIDKIVDVIEEREEIVEVPKYVTRTVDKHVLVETFRENIIQVPNETIIHIYREEPVDVFEELEVPLHEEVLVPSQSSVQKEYIQQQISQTNVWDKVEVTQLVPTPFAVSEQSAQVDFGALPSTPPPSSQGLPPSNHPHVNASDMTEEVIVQDFVETEVIKNVAVPETVVTTRNVIVPVFEIQEQIVEVPQVRYEDNIIEVPTNISVDKIQTIYGPDVEEIFEQEVLVPRYVDKVINLRVDVPHMVVNKTNITVPVYVLQEELVTVEKEIFEDEIVEVPRIVQVAKYRRPSGTASASGGQIPATGNASAGSNSTSNPLVRYVDKEVVRRIEIPYPVYVDREVIVPVYQVDEVVVEIPKVTYVEELVEVPRIIEVDKIVEVPRVEYNDVVLEKIVKVPVQRIVQRPRPRVLSKVVNKNTEKLESHETISSVSLTVQVPKYSPYFLQVNQTSRVRQLSLTTNTSQVNKTKVVIAKKRVERLVPRVVSKVIQKPVEVVREMVVEKVVPIYKETVIDREVQVPVVAVKEWVVHKNLKRQMVTVKQVQVEKVVQLKYEVPVNITQNKQVQVKGTMAPKIVYKNVPVAVPCTAPRTMDPSNQWPSSITFFPSQATAQLPAPAFAPTVV